jgi:hypothetical protein
MFAQPQSCCAGAVESRPVAACPTAPPRAAEAIRPLLALRVSRAAQSGLCAVASALQSRLPCVSFHLSLPGPDVVAAGLRTRRADDVRRIEGK